MPASENKRSHRVAQLIQKELGEMLVEGLKDPRIGFATVTEVRLTDDLRSATIFVSVYGAQAQVQDSLAGLRAATGFLRRELAQRLRLRFAPELTFSADTSLAYADRVQTLLHAAARGDAQAPPPATESTLPPVDLPRSMPTPERYRAPVAKKPPAATRRKKHK